MQDGGGSIDSKELKDLMASVGQNPTDDELAEMIRIADADGTGALSSRHAAMSSSLPHRYRIATASLPHRYRLTMLACPLPHIPSR